MAHINVRLSDEDLAGGEGGGEPHPEGPMRMIVHSYQVKEKNDGSGKYISWRLNPNQDGITSKKPVWLNTSIASGKFKGTKAFLDAAQIPYELDAEKNLTFDPDDGISAELIVNLGIETYNNKARNNVNFPYQKVK